VTGVHHQKSRMQHAIPIGSLQSRGIVREEVHIAVPPVIYEANA
jgi:hypothetical protein